MYICFCWSPFKLFNCPLHTQSALSNKVCRNRWGWAIGGTAGRHSKSLPPSGYLLVARGNCLDFWLANKGRALTSGQSQDELFFLENWAFAGKKREKDYRSGQWLSPTWISIRKTFLLRKFSDGCRNLFLNGANKWECIVQPAEVYLFAFDSLKRHVHLDMSGKV